VGEKPEMDAQKKRTLKLMCFKEKASRWVTISSQSRCTGTSYNDLYVVKRTKSEQRQKRGGGESQNKLVHETVFLTGVACRTAEPNRAKRKRS